MVRTSSARYVHELVGLMQHAAPREEPGASSAAIAAVTS
jgi:hypothetical protein